MIVKDKLVLFPKVPVEPRYPLPLPLVSDIFTRNFSLQQLIREKIMTVRIVGHK